MKLIAAKHVSAEKVDQFVRNNTDVNKTALLDSGYMVEIDQQVEGCFVFTQVEAGVYWLKQLSITKKAAPSLPVLLESILALAKERNARSVHVHSHQPLVDVLLQSLQFHPQKENVFVDNLPERNGSWWAYNVS